MYELLGNITFYSPLIIYPENLIKKGSVDVFNGGCAVLDILCWFIHWLIHWLSDLKKLEIISEYI